MTKKIRVLLTGAGGLLGRHLVGLLTGQGHAVMAVSSQPEAQLRQKWESASNAYRADLVEVVQQEDILETPLFGVDVFINSGFARVHHGTELAEALSFQARILENAHVGKVGRVVNVSSQSVYDPARVHAAVETDAPALTTPYATAKFAQEILASSLVPTAELVQVRLASLIGVGFDQRVVNKLTARAIADGRLTVIRDQKVFDFMDVRDASRAIALLCTVPLDKREVIVNAGAGQPHSLAEMAAVIADAVKIQRGIDVSVDVEAVESERFSSELDCTRLAADYGFSAMHGLRNTVDDLIRATRPDVPNGA